MTQKFNLKNTWTDVRTVLLNLLIQISTKIKETLKNIKDLQVLCNEKQWNVYLDYVMIGLEGHLDTVEKYETLEVQDGLS